MDWIKSIIGGPFGWIVDIGVKAVTNIFKDWRRDQELKDKGRIEQQNANLTESNKRRDEADKIKRDVETGEQDFSGDL